MSCVRTFPAKPGVPGANPPGAALKGSLFGTGDEDSGMKPHLSPRPDETEALKLPSPLEGAGGLYLGKYLLFFMLLRVWLGPETCWH